MNVLAQLFEDATSTEEYIKGYCDHLAGVLKRLDADAIGSFVGALEKAVAEDKMLFFVANGGSAAVASHYVNDLGANSVVDGLPGIRVMSLTDNSSSITALANDASFEEVFEIQLKANMRPGDLVVFMSVSGNSPNLLRAAEYAKAHGGYTVACTGFDGGKLREICDLVIHTPSTRDEYGPIEDVFGVVMHVVTGYLTMKRGRKLSH